MKPFLTILLFSAVLAGCSAPTTMELAEDGNSDAMYEIALRLLKSGDHNNAANWMKKSANAGNKNAQFKLANWYHLGVGVEKDNDKALSWLEKAAHNNHYKAANVLGNAYRHGKMGVDKNAEKALLMFRRSLNTPTNTDVFVRDSMIQMGQMQLFGEAGKADETMAIKLFLASIRLPKKQYGSSESLLEQKRLITTATAELNEIYAEQEPYEREIKVSTRLGEFGGKSMKYYTLHFEPKNKPIVLTDISFNNGSCNQWMRNKLRFTQHYYQAFNYGAEISLDQGDCIDVYKIDIDTLNYGTVTLSK